LKFNDSSSRNSKSFQLANARFNRYGIDRHGKYRGLLELETLGLIRVKRTHGKSPEIMIIPVPDEGGGNG
jgi:hypothetical protein